ncbi:MAG: hypothetical protein COA99_03810 [Moraxellaceae bacterium]|nr:MAG: hypothetical protein COA99_03810 [Moraxellaceae bacterium]
MKCFLKLVSILVLIACTPLSIASPIAEDTLYELVVLSGVKSQVESLSGAVLAGMTSRGETSSEKVSIVEESLNSNSMLERLTSNFGKSLTQSEAMELISWYSSNFGARVARAEESGSTGDAQVEMQKMAQQLLSDPARLKKIKEMEKVGSLVDNAIDLQITLALSAATVVHQQKNPNKPLNLDILKNITTSQVNGMRSNIEMSIIISLLYTFRDFNIEELDKYIDTLNTPVMMKFNESMNSGMNIAFNEAIRTIAASFKRD